MIESGKLYQYLNKLYKENSSPFKLEFYEEYDEFGYGSSEHQQFFSFQLGQNSYRVGWWNTIEDGEDWAQAESYNGDILIKNENYVYEAEIITDVTNYLQIEREHKLNKILE